MASHLSHSWNATALSRFALNIVRGCTLTPIRESFATNARQVNLIYTSRTTPERSLGNEYGYSVTYGDGYWTDTAPPASPYPGVGTIRRIAEGNFLHNKDGTRTLFGSGHPNLNLSRSGSDDATAEWAARLRAHYTLANVGGSFANEPAVHGAFGDNFLWWDTTLSSQMQDGGIGDAAATTWDTGIVRNHQKRRALLGPDVLLGGNGHPWVCASGPNGGGPNGGGAAGEDG